MLLPTEQAGDQETDNAAGSPTRPRVSRRRPGRGSQMSMAEKSAVQGLALAGLSKSEIARQTGRTREAVRKVLNSEEFDQARQIARSALAENAAQFSEDWRTASREAAKRGNHLPAKDGLLAIKAIEQGRNEPSNGFTVKIGVVLPGLGLLPSAGPLTVVMPTGDTPDAEIVESEPSEDNN